MRFCTLSKESCVINIDKEAINGMDMYWKISVKFGMYFNGTIRRLWVWNLHWCGFDIERNIFWKSWFHKYMDLCHSIHFWIFRKSSGRVQCTGKKQWCALRQQLLISDSKAQLRVKFPKKISVIEKYSTVVVHTWCCLHLLPVFGTIFQKYTNFWQLFCLSANLQACV